MLMIIAAIARHIREVSTTICFMIWLMANIQCKEEPKDQERHDIGFHPAASAHGEPQPHSRVAAVDVATVAVPSQHMFEKLFPSIWRRIWYQIRGVTLRVSAGRHWRRQGTQESQVFFAMMPADIPFGANQAATHNGKKNR